MNKTIFLHIGAPKAASTTIQAYLFQKASTLRALRYSLAGHDLRPAQRPEQAVAFFRELKELPPEDAAGVLASRLRKFRKPNVVISAENLSESSMATIFGALKSKAHMRVLFIIRRQDEWIYSAWKQWFSKAGNSLERYIDMALQRHTPNYPGIVDAWANVVGRDNIRVVSLDFIDGATLNREILGWLRLEDHEELIQPFDSAINRSFDFRILDILARHCGAYADGHDRRIERFLTRYSRLSLQAQYRLSEDDSARILRHFHGDNVRLLGEERAAALASTIKSNRPVVQGHDPESEHDFAIACLLEALGRLSDDLGTAQERIARLEHRLGLETPHGST